MIKRVLAFVLVVVGLCGIARADSVIKIRLSIKVILNPGDGTRPAGATDASINAAIDTANDLLATFWRGYRFERVDPITNVGNLNGFARPNPSHYYSLDFTSVPQNAQDMNDDAHNNHPLYAWNTAAINIFVRSAGPSQCACGISAGNDIIVISGTSFHQGRTYLHEIGHFFGLCHTQGCGRGNCSDGDTTPTTDNIADTLPDVQCWTRDDIAQNSFGMNYADCSTAQQGMVDNVRYNVMSYHGNYDGGPSCVESGHYTGNPACADHTRETELQLDVFADTSNYTRAAVRDGITVFVDEAAGSIGGGSSTLPYRTVAQGLSNLTSSRDIVLVRPGTYPENLTIGTPVTLRAPRTGTARIGAP